MGFDECVLFIAAKIPPGRVSTYGELARALGGVRYSRAVGNALNRNKTPVVVPCHRVVCSDGRVGGYSGGVGEKIRLLKKEGIRIRGSYVVDFKEVLFTASELSPP